MKIAIIVSKKDKGGMNIKQRLIERHGFFESDQVFEKEKVLISKENKDVGLYVIENETIYSENLDTRINAELFIFATKHKSAAKIPSLCVHTPGNWGKAEYGGKDRQLCFAPAWLLREGYLRLKKYALEKNLGFDVVVEVTHHGPYLKKPCMFIEIGSTEQEWIKKEPAEIIADVIMELVKIDFSKQDECFIGIGGLHTSDNFLKVIEKSNLSPSHICPKYALENFDENMFKQAIEKTYGKVKYIILDWKGMGAEKERIKQFVAKLGLQLNIEVKRTADF